MSAQRAAEPPIAAESEMIELSIPAVPELLSLPRMTAAAVAARVGFNVEEVEDIRLAIEELCLAAFEGRGPGRLGIRLATWTSVLEVDCTFEPAEGPIEPSNSRSGLATELTEQLLDALVDEHGTDVGSGVARAWFRKSHPHPRAE
jgi:serine/threonine-protein kinase RsbW